ncbi:hypothetical protein NQ318_021220 [Aromia moschata]|uniref:Uncharacterized protein n=1 Tax=Aromia moschata TaxID=1265417 RepID=A0AAV8X2F4_9CUCU|nr:hypothetical protein NQ318_021220 [Aromia moschata]
MEKNHLVFLRQDPEHLRFLSRATSCHPQLQNIWIQGICAGMMLQLLGVTETLRMKALQNQ